MRNLCFALFAFFGLFSCLDSDLVIPGEQLIDNPPTDNNGSTTEKSLQRYQIAYKLGSASDLSFTTEGKVTNYTQTLGSYDLKSEFIWSTNQLSSLIINSSSEGLTDKTFSVEYDSAGKIESIKTGDNSRGLRFTETAGNLVIYAQTNGTDTFSYALQSNAKKLITSIQSENLTSGERIVWKFVYDVNQNLIQLTEEKASSSSVYEFNYDQKGNPVSAQLQNDRHALLYAQLLYNKLLPSDLQALTFSIVQSTNNPTAYVSPRDTHSFVYEYTQEERPLSAKISQSSTVTGNAIFSYYQ